MPNGCLRYINGMLLVMLLGLGGMYFKNMFGLSDIVKKALESVSDIKNRRRIDTHDFDRPKSKLNKNNNLPDADFKNKQEAKFDNDPYRGHQDEKRNYIRDNNDIGKEGRKTGIKGKRLRFAKNRKRHNRKLSRDDKISIERIDDSK